MPCWAKKLAARSEYSFMSLKVESYVDMDTHGMFICTVTEARVMSDAETMTYTYYQKNVKPKPETEGKHGFVCKVCGWIYEGDELPDDIDYDWYCREAYSIMRDIGAKAPIQEDDDL